MIGIYISSFNKYIIYDMGLWNKTCHFDFFFEKKFPYERARRVGHENRTLRSQKLSLDLPTKKILKVEKMDRKISKLFFCFWLRDESYSGKLYGVQKIADWS